MASVVLCWNCSVKTEVGYCYNCGVEITDPNSVTQPEEEAVEQQQYKESHDYFKTYNSDYYTIIYLLVGVNAIFYVITSIIGGSVFETGYDAIVLFGSSSFALDQGRYYVLLTSMFTHANLFHIFFNMYALGYLANRLGQLGYTNTGLLFFYFGSGLLEAYLTTLITSTVGVGASSALFGWIGVYIAVLRRNNKPEWSRYFKYAIIYLVISLVIPGISFFGHFFGFVIGLLMGSTTLIDIFKKQD